MKTTRLTSGLAATRAALQWRLLTLWAGLLLVPTLLLALPVWRTLSSSLDNSVRAAALANQLDLVAITDLIANLGKNSAATSGAGITALGLTLLLSPLLSGLVITAARARHSMPNQPAAGFGALLTGAFSQYGRMLRMLVWALVPLGLALGAGGAALNAAGKHAATLITEADASLPSRLALLGAVLLFLLANATLDAGRAELALDTRRTSAVKAWWRGLKLLFQRPLAASAIYLAITVAGLLLAGLFGIGRLNLPAVGVPGLIGAFALTQVIALALAWMRSARLFALIDLARARQAGF